MLLAESRCGYVHVIVVARRWLNLATCELGIPRAVDVCNLVKGIKLMPYDLIAPKVMMVVMVATLVWGVAYLFFKSTPKP